MVNQKVGFFERNDKLRQMFNFKAKRGQETEVSVLFPLTKKRGVVACNILVGSFRTLTFHCVSIPLLLNCQNVLHHIPYTPCMTTFCCRNPSSSSCCCCQQKRTGRATTHWDPLEPRQNVSSCWLHGLHCYIETSLILSVDLSISFHSYTILCPLQTFSFNFL